MTEQMGNIKGVMEKLLGLKAWSMKVIEDSAFSAGANSQEATPFLKGR